MVKFDRELTREDIFNIKRKKASKTLTIHWKCEKKIDHTVHIEKSQEIKLVGCETNKPYMIVKWNGKKFVSV